MDYDLLVSSPFLETDESMDVVPSVTPEPPKGKYKNVISTKSLYEEKFVVLGDLSGNTSKLAFDVAVQQQRNRILVDAQGNYLKLSVDSSINRLVRCVLLDLEGDLVGDPVTFETPRREIKLKIKTPDLPTYNVGYFLVVQIFEIEEGWVKIWDTLTSNIFVVKSHSKQCSITRRKGKSRKSKTKKKYDSSSSDY